MTNLPVIESAYRHFLARKYEMHEYLLELTRGHAEGEEQMLLSKSKIPRQLPGQVWLPGAMGYYIQMNILSNLRRGMTIEDVAEATKNMPVGQGASRAFQIYFETLCRQLTLKSALTLASPTQTLYLQLVDDLVESCQLDSVIANL